jgi:hypothetical protein
MKLFLQLSLGNVLVLKWKGGWVGTDDLRSLFKVTILEQHVTPEHFCDSYRRKIKKGVIFRA